MGQRRVIEVAELAYPAVCLLLRSLGEANRKMERAREAQIVDELRRLGVDVRSFAPDDQTVIRPRTGRIQVELPGLPGRKVN